GPTVRTHSESVSLRKHTPAGYYGQSRASLPPFHVKRLVGRTDSPNASTNNTGGGSSSASSDEGFVPWWRVGLLWWRVRSPPSFRKGLRPKSQSQSEHSHGLMQCNSHETVSDSFIRYTKDIDARTRTSRDRYEVDELDLRLSQPSRSLPQASAEIHSGEIRSSE